MNWILQNDHKLFLKHFGTETGHYLLQSKTVLAVEMSQVLGTLLCLCWAYWPFLAFRKQYFGPYCLFNFSSWLSSASTGNLTFNTSYTLKTFSSSFVNMNPTVIISRKRNIYSNIKERAASSPLFQIERKKLETSSIYHKH